MSSAKFNGVDDSAPQYLLNAQGRVCKVRSDEGTVTFYDQQGKILAAHDLAGGFSRSLEGRWSQDGLHFLATTPKKRGHIVRFRVLNLKGEKVGEVKVPPLQPPPKSLSIHPASNGKLLVVQSDHLLAAFEVEY